MADQMLHLYVWQRTARTSAWDRLVADEEGEGVISVAIAVLIMAFLGAAMWVAFRAIFNDAETTIGEQVRSIGSDGGGGAGSNQPGD